MTKCGHRELTEPHRQKRNPMKKQSSESTSTYPHLAIVLDEASFRRIIREEIEAGFATRPDHRRSETRKDQLPDQPKERLTNEEACEYLGLSRMTLQRYRDKGILEYAKIGSNIYYERRAILKLLSDNTMMSIK